MAVSNPPAKCIPLIDRIYEAVGAGIISFDREGCSEFMPYEGRLGDVVEALIGSLHSSSLESARDTFLFSSRLLIGIIDYGLRHSADVLGLKQQAESAGFEAFRGDRRAALEAIEGMYFGGGLRDAPVVEKADNISWAAFDPSLVEDLMIKMEDCNARFDYIVLDGHDAYRPGLIVAVSSGNPLCAIRNAQDSGRDTKPMLLKGEREYLKRELKGKKVLVLGEDVSTGRALYSLVGLVYSLASPKKVITAAPIAIPGHPEGMPQYYGEERNSF